ncbi:MAG: DUF3891 family protein [Pseudomonadota bacterium]
MIKVALDQQGDVHRWGVVRQVDHARLSFDLAERSTLLSGLPDAVKSEVLCAIDHHDDGWQERDLAIEIDLARNRPRTFDEMTVDEALAIWGGSIARAQGFGVLSGWTVAGHFAYLATLKNGAERPIGRAWAAEREAARARWLRDWLALDPSHRAEHAETALACLRLFDSLSLYVVGVGLEPQRTLRLPNGQTATVKRLPNGVYSAEPWFFDRDEVSFDVAGVLVDDTEIVGQWRPTMTFRRDAD